MIMLIAEAGISHGGDPKKAAVLIQEAVEAGADAIKFQLFTPNARPKGVKYVLKKDSWRRLAQTGKDLGITVFWSVFDFESAHLARKLGNWVKLSFVCKQNAELIRLCNKLRFERKFISVDLHGQYGRKELAGWDKLYCPNNGWSGIYPTKDSDIEWELYEKAAKETGMGYSCHSEHMTTTLVAAAYGARVIEKHFALDKAGPDGAWSLAPEELRYWVPKARMMSDDFYTRESR